MAKDKNGKLLAIATKNAKRAPMVLKEETIITTEKGVNGDHRGKPGERQVTVVSQISWDKACQELHNTVPWIARRANLLIDGFTLEDKAGYYLQVGDSVLKITGETKPCDRMDEFFNGLQEALRPEWRAGVTCKVIKSGKVKLGDKVRLSESID